MSKCSYKEVGYIENRYPRFEYKSECGYRYIDLNHVVWNGIENVVHTISGKCPKCEKEIKIVETIN